MGVEEGEVIEHPLVTGAIARAQKRVEAHNFDIRKHLLEYDDVMNQQREVVYGCATRRCSSTDMSETVHRDDRRRGARPRDKAHRTDGSAHRDEWNLKRARRRAVVPAHAPVAPAELEAAGRRAAARRRAVELSEQRVSRARERNSRRR